MKIDPETIQSDFIEAYQRWEHRFNKSKDNIQECFKETAFVPFEPTFDPAIPLPNWKALVDDLKKAKGKEVNGS